MSTVFLALPSYGGIEPEALATADQPLLPGSPHRVIKARPTPVALLPFTFNQLWCHALNSREKLGLTHFAMAHGDILAEAGWLDVLLAEMDRVGADVLSTVIAIKEEGGETSTAGLNEHMTHRFTFKDLAVLPPTFDAAVLHPGELLVNTGLFVCRFDQPWVSKVDEQGRLKVAFHYHDYVLRGDDGTFRAYNMPEDWNFSLDAARLGAKVFATRLVKAEHIGRKRYPNWIDKPA